MLSDCWQHLVIYFLYGYPDIPEVQVILLYQGIHPRMNASARLLLGIFIALYNSCGSCVHYVLVFLLLLCVRDSLPFWTLMLAANFLCQCCSALSYNPSILQGAVTGQFFWHDIVYNDSKSNVSWNKV